jgi:hypothetical protein
VQINTKLKTNTIRESLLKTLFIVILQKIGFGGMGKRYFVAKPKEKQSEDKNSGLKEC